MGNYLDFEYLIIIFFILIITFIFFNTKFSVKKRASLSLVLGILGTFVGVSIALLNFDTDLENPTLGINKLINGLQTAFVTSIFGLVSHFLLKFNEKTIGKSDSIGEELIKSIHSLNKSISDDSDSSLVSQIKLLRSENKDGFDKINRSFENFAEKMVEDNSKTLIEALEEVIRDFNTKISEQLGDNFKKFNESLTIMLEWQKDYKDQVENLVSDYSKFRSSADSLDKTLENVSTNHESITKSNEKLYALIEDFSSEVNSFAELGEKANSSLPIIEEKVNSIVSLSKDHLSTSIETLKQDLESITSTHKDVIDTFNDRIKTMIDSSSNRVQEFDKQLGDELTKSLDTFGNSLATLSSKFAEDYTPITQNIKKLIDSLNSK
ncbi:hypothetical protein N9O97_01565 [Flavobacteriaceae bacterium]|jgi:DNA anti-recombination protein RmuC|nr:hypothetical protein [Flavobacteriaceae bacterium]